MLIFVHGNPGGAPIILNVTPHSLLALRERPLWSPNHPWMCQMSKRKPATVSKHARSPKIAAKAHRANQAVVRSPKDSRQRSVERVWFFFRRGKRAGLSSKAAGNGTSKHAICA